METKDVIVELRKKNGLSQDELAEKVLVTRQAVSRWETGETIPNTETLKLLSKLFNFTINTLLGSPQQLICQCFGMPSSWLTTTAIMVMCFAMPIGVIRPYRLPCLSWTARVPKSHAR